MYVHKQSVNTYLTLNKTKHPLEYFQPTKQMIILTIILTAIGIPQNTRT